MARIASLTALVLSTGLSADGPSKSDPALREEGGITRLLRTPEGTVKSWSWRHDCDEGPRAEDDESPYAHFPRSKRATWRGPPGHEQCCVSAKDSRCFRGVFDGHVAVGDGPEHAEEIRKLIEQTYGLRLRATKKFTQVRKAETKLGPSELLRQNWSELHADYYENKDMWICALLYHGNQEVPAISAVGGEMGLVDTLVPGEQGTPTLGAGLVVEPSPGRLVVHTGGGENYHAVLKLVQGSYKVTFFWYGCDCPLEDL